MDWVAGEIVHDGDLDTVPSSVSDACETVTDVELDLLRELDGDGFVEDALMDAVPLLEPPCGDGESEIVTVGWSVWLCVREGEDVSTVWLRSSECDGLNVSDDDSLGLWETVTVTLGDGDDDRLNEFRCSENECSGEEDGETSFELEMVEESERELVTDLVVSSDRDRVPTVEERDIEYESLVLYEGVRVRVWLGDPCVPDTEYDVLGESDTVSERSIVCESETVGDDVTDPSDAVSSSDGDAVMVGASDNVGVIELVTTSAETVSLPDTVAVGVVEFVGDSLRVPPESVAVISGDGDGVPGVLERVTDLDGDGESDDVTLWERERSEVIDRDGVFFVFVFVPAPTARATIGFCELMQRFVASRSPTAPHGEFERNSGGIGDHEGVSRTTTATATTH